MDNIFFEDHKITPSEVPRGVNHDNSVVLDRHTFYSLKIVLQKMDISSSKIRVLLLGRIIHKIKLVFFPIPSCSVCVPILNGMTNYFQYDFRR